MSHMVELHPGDLLVLRRADATMPDIEEQHRLSVLAADLGLIGVLVLGVDDEADGARYIGRVAEVGSGGHVDVIADRDLAEYPCPGARVFVVPREAERLYAPAETITLDD